MNVLMISPGFPIEMPYFTRGLAQVGATVLGIGDQARGALDEDVAKSLAAYLQVRDLWDVPAVVREVQRWLRGKTVDRVECLWEPGMELAAHLREALGAPGLSVAETIPFRDKEQMKRVLDEHGVRTPKHASCRSEAECRAAAERIGYPLIIKPIAGAGSADTYPLHEPDDLDDALKRLGHIDEVSVEEFIKGEELTFDTVSANGRPLFQNVAWYRPSPLVARLNPWISAQAIALRDIDVPHVQLGRELGYKVLEALRFQSGFTHMEWFLTNDGEAVFGEIGGRPPGGRLVHVMNYSCDIDLFVGWAEAVCYGRLSQDTTKKYNASIIFKRAEGGGKRITRIEGLEPLLANYGEHTAAIELPRIGEARKDWRRIVSGDGWIVVRHPDLDSTIEMSNHYATDLRLFSDA